MNTDQPTGEPRLLLRAGRGEVDALSDLYDRHGAALYRLALALARDPRAAASAVCEAFQLAPAEAQNAPDGQHDRRDRQELATHVFAVCRADRVPRRRRSSPDAVRDHAGSHPGDPEVSGDNDAPVETLQAQDMLALTMHGGHTYREAAMLLRLDPPAAAALLRSSLLALSTVSPEDQTGDQR